MNERKVFTYQLTNGTFTVNASNGFTKFSIYNASAVTGTYVGNETVDGINSTAVDVAQGETAVVDVGNAYVIQYLLITAPASCTLKLMAS